MTNCKKIFCSKSHDDRVLFEYTSAIWAHIARGKAECYMSPNSMSILKKHVRFIWHFGQNLLHQKEESTGWSLSKQPVDDKSTSWSLSKLPVEVRFVTGWGAVCDQSVQCKMGLVCDKSDPPTGHILHCTDRSQTAPQPVTNLTSTGRFVTNRLIRKGPTGRFFLLVRLI